MALAKNLKELLETLDLDLKTYLKKSYQLFEVVDTGYVAKGGRKFLTEIIYHGFVGHVCRHCGSPLKKKVMYLVKKSGRNHVVNGLSKEVEDGDGKLYVVWVCSCECVVCSRRQRVLPAFAGRWMHHTLIVVARTLLHLFKNNELTGGPMEPCRDRPMLTVPFYGEMSTVYRWRQRAEFIFNL